MKRILLIGAGHANIVVLRHFARHRPDADVVLVNDTEHAWYTGALPALIRGDIKPEQARLDLIKLTQAAGATFIAATYHHHGETSPVMAGPDPAIHAYFINHGPLACDFLSLSTGGVKTAHGIKPIPAFLLRLAQWETSPNPKIGIIGAGASGIEIALALRIRLGPRAQIHIQSRNGALLPGAPPKAQKAAARALQLADIQIVATLPAGLDTITAYTPEPTTQITETLQLSPSPIPPVILTRPVIPALPVIPAKAGIPLPDQTASNESDPRRNDDEARSRTIFATGDGAKFPQPLPRSGAIAVRQGRTLAHNLTHARLKKFEPPTAILAILSVNSHQAIAWYGKYACSGRLPMRLKHYIDKHWLSQ